MPTGVLTRMMKSSIAPSLALSMALTMAFAAFARADDPPSKKSDAKSPKGAEKPPRTEVKKSKSRPARWKSNNAAGLPWRTGERPVQLWPPPKDAQVRKGGVGPINLGRWRYESRRSANPADGVPWELIVTPGPENEDGWISGNVMPPGTLADGRFRHAKAAVERGPLPGDKQPEDAVPIIKLPEIVWRTRMAADLQDVVGIHFHEYVSDDVARILYTIHKVPPDNPDGTPNTSYEGKAGTRIEATLLTPVIWSLDQTIVVRVDNERTPIKEEREKQTAYRIDHEAGHSEVSQEVLLAVLAGPQNWGPKYCRGRRSAVTYYWKRELIGRGWDDYQRGIDKVATLRTSVALVPPTRWSLLLPIPPSRITQKHLQMFNDAIVLLGPQFADIDAKTQEKFHAHHGEYDQPVGP